MYRVSSLDKNKYFLAFQTDFFLKPGMGVKGPTWGMFQNQDDWSISSFPVLPVHPLLLPIIFSEFSF